MYEDNVQKTKELRLQCDAVKANINELQRRKGELIACLADVSSSDTDSLEAKLAQLQQLARDAAGCDCMRGVEIAGPQQNYASKLLLAAVSDMRDAVPTPVHVTRST
jgi:hypothetical protein